jgi:hypothetical protein
MLNWAQAAGLDKAQINAPIPAGIRAAHGLRNPRVGCFSKVVCLIAPVPLGLYRSHCLCH